MAAPVPRVLILSRWLALGSYGALLALLALWFGWLHPPQVVPPAAAVTLALAPLLTALPGLVRGRPYTHAWAALLVLAYLAHGIMEAVASPATAGIARLEVLLASLFFAAAVVYARVCARRLRQAPGDPDPQVHRSPSRPGPGVLPGAGGSRLD